MILRKPRKMPKNQRAYPKKDKPRWVDVQQPEADELVSANLRIGSPHIVSFNWNDDMTEVESVRVNADELRKWRALRNPPTSGIVE